MAWCEVVVVVAGVGLLPLDINPESYDDTEEARGTLRPLPPPAGADLHEVGLPWLPLEADDEGLRWKVCKQMEIVIKFVEETWLQ